MKSFREHLSGCYKRGIAVPNNSEQSNIGYIYCNKYNAKCDASLCLKDRINEKD